MQEKKVTVLPVSIVIPTYSEEELLPLLLKSIKGQILQPFEVIVADAQSPDRTRDIAKSFGAKIVEGGRIAEGRNAGAKVAKGEFLLFLDSDTVLPSEFTLGRALIKFFKNDLDIASARYLAPEHEEPNFGKVVGTVFYGIWNIYTAVQNLFPKPIASGGAFILVKKDVYNRVNGFDEKINIGEDRDFFKRVAKTGAKFKRLSLDIETSVRRYSTPKKVLRLIPWYMFNAAIIAVGAYAGSKVVRKGWGLYGKLGGGEGKSPVDKSKEVV